MTLKYTYKVMRYYNSIVRGERINMGIMIKDQTTGRCLWKVRSDFEALRGIIPDASDKYLETLKLFYGMSKGRQIREWHEDPGHLFNEDMREQGMGRAMAVNKNEKGGNGIGTIFRPPGKEPVDCTTLEANLERLFEEYCTPYHLNKKA